METNIQELQFIDEIIANPFEDEPRLVYADWLEEQQDSRAKYLRMEIEFSHLDPHSPEAIERLKMLKGRIEFDRRSLKNVRAVHSDWIAKVGTKFDYFLHSFGDRKLDAVKTVKSLVGMTLMEAKRYVESEMPKNVLSAVPLSVLILEPNQSTLENDSGHSGPLFVIHRHDKTIEPSEHYRTPRLYDVVLASPGVSSDFAVEWLSNTLDIIPADAETIVENCPIKIGLAMPSDFLFWQLSLLAYDVETEEEDAPKIEFREQE